MLVARWRVPASWRIRAEAAGVALDNAKTKTGTTVRTARAVDSAMRVRTAPPFVRRDCAPGSARCWAGSGHCIRAPNGEQGGVVRSGSLPQGVRPVVFQPSGCSSGWSSIRLWLGLVGLGACPQASARRPSAVSAVLIVPLSSVTAGASASRLLTERPNQALRRTIYRRSNETGVRVLRSALTWTFG